MQALYNLVRWLYSQDLPFEYDNEVKIAMINVSRAMFVDKIFIPKLTQHTNMNIIKLYDS